MKTFVKTLLMILLAVSIIWGTAWYLLEYDTDFTHDLLLEGARFFEKRDQHTIATWLYNTAYKYGHSIEEISLELANYYQSVGNYAKLEETLLRAIKDGGSAEIYVALSRAFVQQDKILDALRLIEGVQDEAIRKQLALLRPAAPVPSMPSGIYNEYFSLSFQAEAGSIYVSATQIPSVNKDAYTDSIPLSTGQTVLYALVVGENGLVSALTEHSYTIKGIVEPVVFADKEMEKAIRKEIGIPEGVTIYTNELWDITSLSIPESAQIYADLKYLPNLKTLSITNGKDALSFIGDLESLTSLTIKGTPVTSDILQMIFRHTELTTLTLRNCNISSVSGIEALKKLTYLDLGENIINNLGPLAELSSLQVLQLDHNAIDKLNALQKLSALQELDLSNNSIDDLSPIANLTSLQKLILRNNLLKNTVALGSLNSLSHLDISFNKLTDINSLSKCVNLAELWISNNQITNISPLAKLIKLQSLDFSHNLVTVLPTWNKNCLLYSIDGSYNKISNIAPLSGLANLNMITLDYNEKLSNVSALAVCPNLGMLSVYGTKVKDIRAFYDLNIQIYYNPT